MLLTYHCFYLQLFRHEKKKERKKKRKKAQKRSFDLGEDASGLLFLTAGVEAASLTCCSLSCFLAKTQCQWLRLRLTKKAASMHNRASTSWGSLRLVSLMPFFQFLTTQILTEKVTTAKTNARFFPIGFFWIEDYRHRACREARRETKAAAAASTEASIASLARRPP